MRSEFSLIDPAPAEPKPESAESINLDATRTRQRLDRHMREVESGFRRMWIVLAVIGLGLLGAAAYAYFNLKQSHPLLTDIPALQNLTGSMGDRIAALESNVNDGTAARSSLADRMTRLESNLGSNAKAARSQAQTLAAQMGQGIRQEVGQSLHALTNRVEGVESTQRETQDHVAQLQTEVGGLRQQVAGLQQDNAQQLAQLQASTKSDFDRVNNQMTTHANHIAALDNEVGRQKVGFELSANQTREIVPGVYVTINRTDVEHQKVDGWMQIASEGRILWIRGLDAQQPFSFVSKVDSRGQSLVFTSIKKDGAAGYVLVPNASEPAPLAMKNE